MSPAAIDRFTDSLRHRGPDGRGVWREPASGIALGHRRLAILDLTKEGEQPMSYAGGRFWLTYNGEIFNFLELRAELEEKGHVFRSASDSEVILAAYQEWGPGMLKKFNGMWAFAIYDRQNKSLFLSRDRFGIKPLLYLLTKDSFAFASELKAFCQLEGFDPQIDSEAGAVFLQTGFGVEASSRTLFQGVQRLHGGHYAVVQDGKIVITRWWNTLEHLCSAPDSFPEQAERFRDLFLDSVKLRMRSDVPIGTCLSGGFDSSAIACALASIGKTSKDPRQSKDWQQTFTATFPGASNDERPQAEEVIRFAGIQGNFLPIHSEDAPSQMDKILSDFDDVYWGAPNSVWAIYRELRRAGVVVSLDGHGADELMGAYKSVDYTLFFNAPSLFKFRQNFLLAQTYWSELPPESASFARAKGLAVALLHHHPNLRWMAETRRLLYRGIGRYSPGNPDGLLRRLPGSWARFTHPASFDALPETWGPVNRMLYPMFHTTILPSILRNFDRLSMAHGIEIRMPYMDWRLVCFLFSLPDSSKIAQGQTKRVAREALRGRMPERIRSSRTKIGFNSPLPEWLNGPLAEWALDLVHTPHCLNHEWIDGRKLQRFFEKRNGSSSWNWHNSGTAWKYLNYLWFEKNFIRMNSGATPGQN